MTETAVLTQTHPGLRGLDAPVDLEALLAMRPKTFAALDAAFEAYFHMEVDEQALSIHDRVFCAWKAASLLHATLAEAYLARLKSTPAAEHYSEEKTSAMERHVTRLVLEPSRVTAEDVAALQDAGLTLRQVVELSQAVAFVTYQARVLHGLRMWGKETR